jgi:hypothetical protein
MSLECFGCESHARSFVYSLANERDTQNYCKIAHPHLAVFEDKGYQVSSTPYRAISMEKQTATL